MQKIGFDTNKYLKEQTKKILERVGKFEKLYLEFGGKLCYDLHAKRVLPGYKATAKVELLKHLKDIEIYLEFATWPIGIMYIGSCSIFSASLTSLPSKAPTTTVPRPRLSHWR